MDLMMAPVTESGKPVGFLLLYRPCISLSGVRGINTQQKNGVARCRATTIGLILISVAWCRAKSCDTISLFA
jgi:uncharacterized membrane protein